VQPRTAADFAILHGELAAWWGQEEAKIKGANIDEGAKQEALRQLLAKVRQRGFLQLLRSAVIWVCLSRRAAGEDN
jgi:hypothetical protein